MFNTIRNWFNKPRLTLLQHWNVATLLSLLEDLPAENYDHTTFGFDDSSDRGCALGLARNNFDKFYIPTDKNALWPFRKAIYLRDLIGHYGKVSAFGEGMHMSVFVDSAFGGGKAPDVTKKMVIDRIKAYAYEGYRYG